MLRLYVMEFYQGVSHVGTRSLIAQSATDAVKEARYLLRNAWDTNRTLTHADVLDIRDDVEVVATVAL